MMKRLIGVFFFKIIISGIHADAATYYFSSTDGNDSRTNAQAQSSSTPWKSIDKLNSVFTSLQPGDQVLFKRGDIFYGGINISKSGSAGAPIVFGAYGSGNKPVISGFTTISSWTSVGNGLYDANVLTESSAINMVTMDGAFQVMGKYPKGNSGYLAITSGSTSSIESPALAAVPNFTGGEIVWRPYHWALWRGTVKDQSPSSVSFTPFPATSGGDVELPQPGYGFFFQNHPNACTSLGEWAYNSSSHKITMYFGASGPGTHVVKVSLIEDLVDLYQRSYINFDNIALQGANTETFSIINSNNIVINACDISFSGYNAVKANSECSNITVANCNISYSNFNGIVASASPAWTITANTITNTAAVAGMGGSGEGQYFGMKDIGSNSVIKNNNVISTGYVPICFQGTKVLVQNNFIDTFCTVKDDGGGIYFGGYSFAGSKVIGNIVLNGIGISRGTPDPDLRAHGIYADDGASDVEIGNNTSAFNGNSGIYNHGSYNLSIYNNTLFDNKISALKYYNDRNTIANITLTGNIFFAKTTSQFTLRSSGGTANPKRFFNAADNNYWCRPLNESNHIETSSGNYDLAKWKNFTGKESNSHSTPIKITDIKKIRFEYNATSSTKVVNLETTYIDVKGKKYSGALSLAPYSSVILMYAK